MLSIIIAVFLILILALLPVYAWPLTRPFTLPALTCYLLFLFLHHDFVLGATGVYHDSFWSYELFVTITRQWLESGNEFGWNPYVGGGQPIAIFNNLLMLFPTIFFHFLFKIFALDLSNREFFNLVFIFFYLNICSGTLLLVRLLNNTPVICYLAFGSILFGGFFQSELGTPLGLIYLTFFSFSLFFLIHFYKTQRVENLLFFSLLLGMSTAYYIPLYHVIAIGFLLFVVFVGCFIKIKPDFSKKVLSGLKVICKRPLLLAVASILFVLSASPTFYFYSEVQDYVSPTRGFTQSGKLGEKSFMESVAVAPKHYKKIMDFYEDLPEDVYTATHTTFYIGLLPSLGFFIALFFVRNWLFILVAVLLALMSVGNYAPFWDWMVENIPTLDMLRNPFPFGRLATYCVLLTGVCGLASVLNNRVSIKVKLIGVIFATIILFLSADIGITIYLLPSAFLLISITCLVNSDQSAVKAFCGFWLLLFGAVQLAGFSLNSGMLTEGNETVPEKFEEFKYPHYWQMYPSKKALMPFNLFPFLNKSASWAVYDPACAFYLQKKFAQYLIDKNIFSFGNQDINSAGHFGNNDDLNYKRKIFHILPRYNFSNLLQNNEKAFMEGGLESALVSRDLLRSNNKNTKKFAGNTIHELSSIQQEESGRILFHPTKNVSELYLDIEVDQSGYLLRLENFDDGWKVWVNGERGTIEKMNPNFQLIPVSKGKQIVRFKYESYYGYLVYSHIVIGVMGFICFSLWLRNPEVFIQKFCLNRIV